MALRALYAGCCLFELLGRGLCLPTVAGECLHLLPGRLRLVDCAARASRNAAMEHISTALSGLWTVVVVNDIYACYTDIHNPSPRPGSHRTSSQQGLAALTPCSARNGEAPPNRFGGASRPANTGLAGQAPGSARIASGPLSLTRGANNPPYAVHGLPLSEPAMATVAY